MKYIKLWESWEDEEDSEELEFPVDINQTPIAEVKTGDIAARLEDGYQFEYGRRDVTSVLKQWADGWLSDFQVEVIRLDNLTPDQVERARAYFMYFATNRTETDAEDNDDPQFGEPGVISCRVVGAWNDGHDGGSIDYGIVIGSEDEVKILEPGAKTGSPEDGKDLDWLSDLGFDDSVIELNDTIINILGLDSDILD